MDLHADESLKVSIADALNEQDIVKFTVQTKVGLDLYSVAWASMCMQTKYTFQRWRIAKQPEFDLWCRGFLVHCR